MNNEFDVELIEGTVADALDPAYAEKTEKMIGLQIPAVYLDFLKAHNGGVPVKQVFKAGENEKLLEAFLCLVPDYKTNEFGDLDIGVVWSRIEDRLNGSLLPFAAASAGDFLCFDYESNEENPKVVLWYHELSVEDEPYLIPVADSFEELLKMLSENDAPAD